MKSDNRTNESPVTGSLEEDEDDNDSLETPKTKLNPDDNVESSSTGSEGGKGTGSGGGYSADCSSSDGSSDDAAKRSVPLKEMKHTSVGGDKREPTTITKDSKNSSSGVRSSSQDELQHDVNDRMHKLQTRDEGLDMDVEKDTSLPQWNGVRILHPMDPRIDLSTVDHIRTSSICALTHNAGPSSMKKHEDEEEPGIGASQVAPSIDQYMNLMEIVRPFFHAHGMSLLQPPMDKEPHDGHTSELANESSGETLAVPAAPLEQITELLGLEQNGPTCVGLSTSKQNTGSSESESSSMVVLARVKRKHLRNRSADDPPYEGSNNSSHGGSNTSSTSSSEKRVRIQHPGFRDGEEESKTEEDPPRIERGINGDDADIDREILEADGMERQEIASASSSESRNDAAAPQNGPMGFGVPTVVSEYSSSRVGSSGASNTNQMSTSGSGSGGNTGSGTGSGSNQGGSSGSGNDQGGISSGGNGSSASGNDVKGSSEEMMDNSAENNSGEGNSDATNSNNERTSKVVINGAAESAHCTGHRHYPNTDDPGQNDLDFPTLSNKLSSKINSNAVRERKLQDKKRKRQIMRREYEEKVQQEMESSEGSREREESALIKPGRPVTLDKVLSFTKVPRIVVSANPPFLVVHTNAAYCRLSGNDSHAVIGKPISILLGIPDVQTLAEFTQEHECPPEKAEDAPDVDSTTSILMKNHDSDQDCDGKLIQTAVLERQGLTSADALRRVRGAAPQVDSVERLIATSGLGRWSIINLNAKPLLGQTLAIINPPEIFKSRSRDEGSIGGSKCEGSYRHIVCSMGVSPVVSSPEAFTVVTDKEQESHHKSKRRKHHQSDSPNQTNPHHQQQLRRSFLHREISMHRKRHLITHFLIQLEPIEGGSRMLSSLESQSSISTTGEAQMLGVTKAELRMQRGRAEPTAHMAGTEPAQESDDDVMDSESSNSHQAVTAVG